ncbi:MAG: hypothetical protein WA908_09005 [Pontixanthobacter sp.]
MIKLLLPIGLLVATAGCGTHEPPPITSQKLAGLDFEQPAIAADIMRQLTAADRQTFTIYLLRHHRKGSAFCGLPLIDATGSEPETVGEAIALTKVREAEYAATLPNRETQPITQRGQYQARLTRLEERRTKLVDEQSEIRMIAGDTQSAALTKALQQYDVRITNLTEKIDALRSSRR